MRPLFGFGFSQEDERIVASMLGVEGQTVLCVASGGDIPLSLLARGARRVIAVDISEAQLHLCRLKAAVIERLDPEAAAALLGFLPSSVSQREGWFAVCMESLPATTAEFWRLHQAGLRLHGAIWCGRYEQFIKKLHLVLRPLLGRAFTRLARCATTAEQEVIFEQRIGRTWLRLLLRVAFSRKVYAGHGVDEQGLANRRTAIPLGEQYWTKLRSFCTATLARKNPWLQIHTLGQLLSLEAAPHYLGDGFPSARGKTSCIDWLHSDLLRYGKDSLPGDVTRVFLSNLPDWCSPADFDQLLCSLADKLPPSSRVLWSSLHTDAPLPAGAPSLKLEECTVDDADRFPFYAYTCARVEGSGDAQS